MEIGLGYVQNEPAFAGSRLALGAEEEDGQGVVCTDFGSAQLGPFGPKCAGDLYACNVISVC